MFLGEQTHEQNTDRAQDKESGHEPRKGQTVVVVTRRTAARFLLGLGCAHLLPACYGHVISVNTQPPKSEDRVCTPFKSHGARADPLLVPAESAGGAGC
nr:MAG: hypothetical protein [Molluscum contagiosum virus]